MTGFVPHTSDEKQRMLEKIGLKTVNDLFSDIPRELKGEISLATLPHKGKDELSLIQQLNHIAMMNSGAEMASFLGGGAYHRFIPSAVNHLAFRSEFYTAYTPYQPEISQGTLQVIYEFQTMMSELTGLDVTNASVYDAANAVCESALMAARITKRSTIAIAKSLNPHYKRALKTYASANEAIQILEVDLDQPLADQLVSVQSDLAAILVQNPDYYGCVRDLSELSPLCQKTGAIFVLAIESFNQVLLKSPAEWGADIACGDIQPFGNPVNYGGPYGGFVSTRNKYVRQLPGRLVGKSTDNRGQEAYTLTLQAREQHIRRSKATSNICTNQALNVLKATIYLTLVGEAGLRDLATVSVERAHDLATELQRFPGVQMRYPNHPFLSEFALTLAIPAQQFIATMARQHHILAGIDVSRTWRGDADTMSANPKARYDDNERHTLLVSVTEMNTPNQIKNYIAAFKESLYHTEPENVTQLNPVIQSKSLAQALQCDETEEKISHLNPKEIFSSASEMGGQA